MNHQKTFMWQMWVILVILNVFDYAATCVYLNMVGMGGEANPLMQWCFMHLGIGMPIVVKLLFLGILGIGIQNVRKAAYGWIGKVLAVMNILTIGIVGLGVYCIIQAAP